MKYCINTVVDWYKNYDNEIDVNFNCCALTKTWCVIKLRIIKLMLISIVLHEQKNIFENCIKMLFLIQIFSITTPLPIGLDKKIQRFTYGFEKW